MLDEFRSTSITWDKATRRIYSPITANASDSNGRKLNIQVVNSGQVKNLTGATLHLYWETKDKTQHGLDAFTASDISKGEFEIFYTTGMLSNVGELNATLVLVDSTGKVVSDWFKITVTRGINEGAIESENSFSSLTQALIDISNLEQNYAPRLNDLTAQLQQTTPYVVSPLMTQQEIQNIINTHSNVKFLNGTYEITFVNGVGFTIPNNRTIEFEDNARIVASASDLEVYHIIKMSGVENVTLNNPTVIGERKTHIGTTGEWGFGISIEKSKNITLIKPKCNDCWGDGIYLGDLNENVMIDRPICDNNRRQGISVISCKTLTIIDPVLKNTNGVDPQSGIDFEPNLGTFGLENIRLVNPYTENNAGMGIVITLVQLSGTNKVVDITIENHKDVGSGHGLYVGACDNLKGSIVVNNPLWINSKNNAFVARDYTSTAPLIKVKSPSIINPHRDSSPTFLADPRYGSVISLYREFLDTTINPLGSLLFEDVIINNNIETYAAIAVRDELTTKKVENLTVRNLISTGLTKRHFYSNVGTMKIKDYDIMTDIVADVSVTALDVIRNYTNKKSSGLVKLTLQSGVPVGCRVSVKIETAHTVEINPLTNTISGFTEPPQRISSNTVGSMIILEKVTDTVWSVINKTGVWTVA